MNKNSLYTIAGSVWGLVGLMLMVRGGLMFQTALTTQNASQTAVILAIIASLVLGTVKGRFVLSKTARRNKSRIEQLEEPLKLQHVYAKSFYFLIVGMIALGISLRAFNEYLGGFVVVGAIYCGIGLALIVSSTVYWQQDRRPVVEEKS